MFTKKRFGIIAVAAALAVVMTMSASSQAAQTECGQSCGKATVAASNERGTRTNATNVAWADAGAMRSGR